jgi:hypothetical protein
VLYPSELRGRTRISSIIKRLHGLPDLQRFLGRFECRSERLSRIDQQHPYRRLEPVAKSPQLDVGSE